MQRLHASILAPALCAGALFVPSCKSSNPPVRRLATVEDARSKEPTEVVPPAPVVEALAPAPGELVIATIGDEEVYVAELLTAWMHVDSVGLRDLLENLVTKRLVEREAEHMGLRIDEALLSAEYSRSLAELERRVGAQYEGMALDEWISGGLGLDPSRYRLRLRADVHERLLAERVVRLFIYGHTWAEVRVIVTEEREEADQVVARVEAGEPFDRLAAEVSIDPSGERGGRIPPVLRNESALSRLAFSTGPGEVGGPVLEGTRWMVLHLDAIHPPLEGSWPDLSDRIEASLAERPIEDPEYWMWKAEMSRQNRADFRPLFDLIGEPPASLMDQP